MKYIIPIIIFILSMSLVLAVTITTISTPTGTTSSSSINIAYNFSQDDFLSPSSIKFSWANVNYSLYDSSLVLMYNFDNRSSLGENDTVVKDLSMYGNNGSVVGGSNISWTPNGKYGGAYNFSGGINYINVLDTDNLDFNTTTISLWFNTINKDADIMDKYLSTGGNRAWAITITSFGRIGFLIANGTTVSSTLTSSSIDLNDGKWHNAIVTYSGFVYTIYIDGVHNGEKLSSIGIYNSIANITIGKKNLLTNNYNGSLDDIMIFNRSFSLNEAQELYQSQLTKYDSQNWTFTSNRSIFGGINSTVPSISYNYYICSSNLTSEVCSASKTLTKIVSNANLITNFSSSIGNIDTYLYGVNTRFGGGGAWIDTNGDGTYETLSNYTFYRNVMNDLHSNILRIDSQLQDVAYEDHTFRSDDGFYASIIERKNLVEYAYNNNKKVLLYLGSMPNWLANTTTGWCPTTSNVSCPPKNYTRWGELALDYINNITNNGQWNSTLMVVPLNEPDGTAFLSSLAVSNINKSLEYNRIWNASRTAIKAVYPNMPVGGTGAGWQIYSSPVFEMFLANFTTQIDFIDYHEYKDDTEANFDVTLDNIYNKIMQNCTYYGANCSRVIISEYNINNASILNTTLYQNQLNFQLALGFYDVINHPERNISYIYYQLAERRGYQYSNYAEYPYRWAMVSEKGLDSLTQDMYYPPYNITKTFTSLCPASSTVYQSSSDDSTIKTVTCKDGDIYNLIVINTDTNSKNISLSSLPSAVTSLTDSNGNTYSVSSNSVNLGVRDSYGISYLSYDSTPPVPPIVQDSTGLTTAILKALIVILGLIIALASISFAYVYARNNFQELDFAEFTMFGVSILIILILDIILMQYIGSLI